MTSLTLQPRPLDPPESWAKCQLRRVVRIENGQDIKDRVVDEGGFPVYGSGGPFARASRPLYDGPSVLFGRKGTIDKPLLVDEPFWAIDTMFYTRISPLIEPRFLYYYATTIPFRYFSTDTALPSMTQSDLASVELPLPPLDTQVAIADFLDRETSRIDKLIEKQDRLIETLEERRRAILWKYLVEGVDPGTPMSQSRVAWMMERPSPAHWRKVKMRYLVHMKAGTQITSEQISDIGPYPVFGGNGMRGFTTSITHKGTYVLVGRQGALCGNVHLVRGEFWASEHAIVVEALPGIDATWLAYLLELMDLGQYSVSAAQPGIGVELISSIPLYLPPQEEQRSLASAVSKKREQIDKLIGKARRFVELLKERRAALITAAVTGEIDVREMGRERELVGG